MKDKENLNEIAKKIAQLELKSNKEDIEEKIFSIIKNLNFEDLLKIDELILEKFSKK